MQKISMKEMIERIIKRANDSYAVAMGTMFTNAMLEGAFGLSKGSLGNGKPRHPELQSAPNLDPKLLSGKSPLDARSVYKLRGKLNQVGISMAEPMDVILRMVESDWAYKLGKSKANDIQSGRLGWDNLRKLIGFKLGQETKDYITYHMKRPEQSLNDPYGGHSLDQDSLDERGMDQFEDKNTRRPGAWADSASELLVDLMEQRGKDGQKIRQWIDSKLRSLRPESVQRVAMAVMEWSASNPGRKLNFTAIGKELGMSRQNVTKFWGKAIEQLSRNVKSDRKIQDILQENSYQLRAAAIKATMAQILKTAAGEHQGVVELCFTLGGSRIASADPSVDPRVHLAASPQTLEWLLNKSASIIQDAVPVPIVELVINEKLSATWAARSANGKTRFKVMVGFRG